MTYLMFTVIHAPPPNWCLTSYPTPLETARAVPHPKSSPLSSPLHPMASFVQSPVDPGIQRMPANHGNENRFGDYAETVGTVLPEYLFACSFAYLPLKDVISASLSSRYLHKCAQATTEVHVPHSVSLQDSTVVLRVSEKFPLSKSLTLDNCAGISDYALAELAARLPDLRRLILRKITSRDLPAILVAKGWAGKLHGLGLSGVLFFRGETIHYLLKALSSDLTEIELCGVRTLSDEHVAVLAKCCPQLRMANFEDCSMLKCLVLDTPSLEKLCLSRCVGLTSVNVGSSCNGALTNLVSLDLSYCRCLESKQFYDFLRAVYMPSLERIDVSFCSKLEDFHMYDSRLPNLKYATMEGCAALHSVVTHGPMNSLQFISVGMCVALDIVSLDVPALKALDLSMLDISTLNLTAKNLQTLDISGCHKLNHLDLSKCPACENVCKGAKSSSSSI